MRDYPRLHLPLCLTCWLLFGLAVADSPERLRIGYQKSSVNMMLAREHHLLERDRPGTPGLQALAQ